jgi:hypothetical protein
MIARVMQFVRLPFLLLMVYTIARFSLGPLGVPYAPRGNAMFSILGLTLISSVYFGALSGKVGGFRLVGAALVGVFIGFFAEILIFAATLLSYVAHLNTYFIHWDALNVPEGTVVPMGRALAARAGGLLAGPILGLFCALIGRALSPLAPDPAPSDSK